MGQLTFQATLGGSVNLAGPNTATTTTFTLPSADGSNGQYLKTNGSGVLSFATVPASQWTTSGSDIYYNTGNVGIGVTPTSIQSGYKAIQIGATVGAGIVSGGTDTYYTNNAYVTGGAWYFGSTGYAMYYNQTGGVHAWTTSTASGSGGGAATMSEKARISAAGGFSVGTTADPGAGAIYATGNITAYYSDARLKTVSGKIENALDKVGKLSGVYYTNNNTAKSFGYNSDEIQVGVLAQDVEAVMPQIVKAAPFDLDENGNSKSGENYKTVQYERLVPLLIEAINELRAEVKALKGE